MSDWKQQLQLQLDQLKAQRDHLHLQVHLAKMEADEQWQHLEKSYQLLRSKSQRVLSEAAGSSREVIDDLRLTGEDIKAGYQRIKNALH